MKMKRVLILLLILLSLLSGCASQNNSVKEPAPQPPAQTAPTIQDYFAYQDNAKYVFEGIGNEYASYTVYVDFIRGNRVQLRSNNGGTEMVQVLENKDGELRLNLRRGECYYREDLTQIQGDPTEILLKEPLTQGTAWTLADGRKRSISNLNVEITTSAGSYKTIEVTTEGKEDVIREFYAPQLGLVKRVFKSNGYEVTSTLARVESNSPLTQEIRFFYPNMGEGKLYAVRTRVSLATNELTKVKLENEFKKAPNPKLSNLLGPNVVIKSLYLNNDNRVYADFSQELLTEMNRDPSTEALILKGLTNTLAEYYQVQKVYITIEGKPYASRNVQMKKGEAFTFDPKYSKEIDKQ